VKIGIDRGGVKRSNGQGVMEAVTAAGLMAH
jgi:hypothetical protein